MIVAETTDLPTYEMSKSINDNFSSVLKELSLLTNSEFKTLGTLGWLKSGLLHPMYNYGFSTSGASVKDSDVHEFSKAFIEKKIPFFFNNGIFFNGKTSGEELISSGATSIGKLDGMHFDFNSPIPCTKDIPGLIIKAVQSEKEYNEFATVMAQSAEIDPTMGLAFFSDFSKLKSCPLVLVLAYFDDKPVGCSMIYLPKTGVAGHYFAWVLPSYRKKGINSKMVEYRLRIAKDKGYNSVVAQCMDSSTRLYASLGFSKVCELDFYSL